MIAWVAAAWAGEVAFVGDVVYPVSGPPIEDGVVLARDGRIVAVGRQGAVAIPADAEVVRGAVVAPGFVDGLCVAGLTGPLNVAADQDHDQPGALVAPELRAIDAYDPWDALVGWLRERGVTTIHTGPSPGVPVGARTAIVSTRAAPTGEVTRAAEALAVWTLGEGPKDLPGGQTRMGSVAAIRQALSEAREYRERRRLPLADRPPVDLGMETLVGVLERRVRVVIVAHRADDILTALRLAGEFRLDVVIGGASEAWRVREELARAGVPVLVGPVMARQWSALGETHGATFENAALLAEAGVPFGFMTGYEAYVPKVRVVGWEAAIAATNGLGAERALAASTLVPAQILGIDGRVGSLEVGKDADVVVYDGDPFEYRTHVCAVAIGGVLVSRECR